MKSPRFNFGLERVREIRAHDEDRAKEAFAASLAHRVQGAAMLAEASRRRQALERLKERRRAEHMLAASRAEAVTLDEIALQQHARGQAA